MKQISSLFLFAILLIVGISSCSKGDDRDDFVGTYNAEDKFSIGGQQFTDTYSFTITKSSNSEDRILLNGFAATPGTTVEALVSGRGMTIPQQTIVIDGTNVGVSGSGTIDGNRLTYSYSASSPGLTLSIAGTANKL